MSRFISPPTSAVFSDTGHDNSSQIAPRACQSWFNSEHHLRVELRRRTRWQSLI